MVTYNLFVILHLLRVGLDVPEYNELEPFLHPELGGGGGAPPGRLGQGRHILRDIYCAF